MIVSMFGSNLMNDKRFGSPKFCLLESAFICVKFRGLGLLFFLCLAGCNNSWNPDQQFESEISHLKKKSEIRQSEVDEKAFRNLINLKSDLFKNLHNDNALQKWILQNRYRFALLASTQHNNLSWEKRVLMFSDIAEFYHGNNSAEHILAKEKDYKVFFVCNLNELISFEEF